MSVASATVRSQSISFELIDVDIDYPSVPIWQSVAMVLLAVLLFGQEAPTGYPGQSNLVPAGGPTPTTAFEQLRPGGPARDPGDNAWAVRGPYILPGWTDFSLRSFSSSAYLATTYYFYWHDLTDADRRSRFSGRFHVPPDPLNYSFL